MTKVLRRRAKRYFEETWFCVLRPVQPVAADCLMVCCM